MENTYQPTEEFAYKPTTHGRAVMAACMAMERPFHVTRVAFGSGKVDADVNLADVHELLAYVSDGAVAERRHEDDRLYLSIQFANNQHPEVKTFLLSEFIVYVEDPATGTETDFLYGTLGDYRQPVPAYNPAFSPSVFTFPLTLILSDEINVSVSAPAGLVTHDELLWLLDGIGTDRIDITIPSSGWVPDTDTGGAFTFHTDIAIAKITEKMVPKVAVPPERLAIAAACALCPAARTLDGLLRVYAKSAPAAPIKASLTLFDTTYQTSGRISGSAVQYLDSIDIPASGWVADTDIGGGLLHLDIPVEQSADRLVPSLTVLPEFSAAAIVCGLSASSRAMDGLLRVYAQTVPTAPIKASLALMGKAPYSDGGGTIPSDSNYSIPAATEDALGGVKVPRGSGLSIDSNGNLTLETATKEQVADIFKSSNS